MKIICIDIHSMLQQYYFKNEDVFQEWLIFNFGFYEKLGAGRSIDTSSRPGINALLLDGKQSHIVPELFRQDGYSNDQ